MCGICGIVSSDPSRPPDSTLVQAMNAAMKHRGPDDAGLWHGGSAVLAMRRLSIIDIEGGRQPMVSEDGRVAVVFNGEIYNFQELRDDLEKRGCHFTTRSDTEVLLRGYEAWGNALLDRLNGMFAFAIYDVARDRLFAARDRLGIKPLHYVHKNGSLAFASELSALRQSQLVGQELDANALDAYLAHLYISAPDTIYRDARKLPPGHTLVCEKGEVRVEPWWRPDFHVNPGWTLESASERFLELLQDSVKKRRISDVPLGAFLSGGLDSSAVVAMLQRVSDRPVKTFTIGFDDRQADELGYARLAAEHIGTEHHETVLRPDMVSMVAQLAQHFGEPFADSSALPTWLVSKCAREHVTVALSGDGGDELFAGYTWLRMNRRVGRYRRWPAGLRRLVDVALRVAPNRPLANKLRRFSADSFLDPMKSFQRRQTCFTTAQRARLYRPGVAAEVAQRAVDRFAQTVEAGRGLNDDERMLWTDTRRYLPDDILTKVDRMSMAVSLEARVPLLDHHLVDFAATLPFHLKMRGNESKILPKHALAALLPPPLLKQRKQGFAIPIQRWFRDELRDHFYETVLAPDARCREYLDTTCIESLVEDHVAGRARYGHHLWALLMLEHWLRDQ